MIEFKGVCIDDQLFNFLPTLPQVQHSVGQFFAQFFCLLTKRK